MEGEVVVDAGNCACRSGFEGDGRTSCEVTIIKFDFMKSFNFKKSFMLFHSRISMSANLSCKKIPLYAAKLPAVTFLVDIFASAIG